MEDRFTRFLNKIGIEDTTPYENCAFSITSYDKVNNICYINIHKEHCFNYIDAKRLLDAINNAPFKNVINFFKSLKFRLILFLVLFGIYDSVRIVYDNHNRGR